jgi:hypothetical protein
MIACTEENNCLVEDINHEIKVVTIGQTTYYLYLQISGWHEKVAFLVLYDKNPLFDNCGRAKQEIIGSIDIDQNYKSPVKIELVDKKIVEIQFEDGANGSNMYSQLMEAISHHKLQEFGSSVKLVIQSDQIEE